MVDESKGLLKAKFLDKSSAQLSSWGQDFGSTQKSKNLALELKKLALDFKGGAELVGLIGTGTGAVIKAAALTLKKQKEEFERIVDLASKQIEEFFDQMKYWGLDRFKKETKNVTKTYLEMADEAYAKGDIEKAEYYTQKAIAFDKAAQEILKGSGTKEYKKEKLYKLFEENLKKKDKEVLERYLENHGKNDLAHEVASEVMTSIESENYKESIVEVVDENNTEAKPSTQFKLPEIKIN